MNKVTIVAIGDIMLGELSNNIGRGVDSYLKNNGYDIAFDNILTSFEGADIVLGNIEAVLDKKDYYENIYSSTLIASPKSVASLQSIKMTVANVANNHCLDHGDESYKNSYKLLKRTGFDIVGSVYNQSISTIIERNGLKFHVIGFSLAIDKNHQAEYYYQPNNINEVIDLIEKYKDEVHHTIITVHWGKEYINYPTLEQRSWAYQFIDAGASLILGHHPHCYQGIENYNNGLIVYSLGNCVFDDNNKMGKESIIIKVELNDKSIISYKRIPINLDKFGIPFYPGDSTILEDKFTEIDKILEQKILLQDDEYEEFFNKTFKIAFKSYRRDLKINFLKNILRTNPKISYTLLKGYFIKKMKK